jgi:Fic/DOC family
MLMEGLVAFSERLRTAPDAIDPVIAASALSFGFVFIHPFMDGNGRLHRYLIHESLSVAGFTPKGIILPVSAVIVANLDRYKSALEAFSRSLRDRTAYNPDLPDTPATGNDSIYFRYFDATEQASFLFDALERTVEHDLDDEISYLLGFDRARQALNSLADWPSHTLETFVHVVHRNNDKLSVNKRKSHFQWMSDDEVERFERIVAQSFDPNLEDEAEAPPTG